MVTAPDPAVPASPYAVVLNGRVLYDPTPKQRLFHESRALYPLYGGARGGGKSKAMRWQAHMLCLRYPGFKFLLLRRTMPELRNNHIRFLRTEAELLSVGPLRAEWMEADKELRYPQVGEKQSVLVCGHCETDGDVEKHLGAEWDAIGFEELVTFNEFMYLMIGGSLRTTIPGWTPRCYATTNPGGVNAHWVRRRWMLKDVTLDEDEAYDPADYEYIPATLDDNPHIDTKTYEKQLRRLPGRLRDAYRYGLWDIFEGQYFDEFDARVHGVSWQHWPSGAEVIGGLDWGYFPEPGVMLWAARLPDGRVLVLDEWKFNGTLARKYVAREVAQEIVRRTKANGWVLRWIAADPSIFSVQGMHSAESTADVMRREGLPILKANNERILGWQRIRSWLRPDEGGDPALVINREACPYLMRTFPAAVIEAHPMKDVGDLDTTGEDHALDALRYLIAHLPPRPFTPASGPPPGSIAELLALERGRHTVLGDNRVRPAY